MRKSDKIFFWFTLVFIIYVSVGFKLIPSIIKDELVKNLDQNLTQKTSLEKVDFNPFTLSATLHNLKIGDIKNPTISFEKFYVDIAVLRSIFELHPSIQDVNLKKLYVNLIEKKDGTFNISTLLKPQDKKVEPLEENKEPSAIKFLISKIFLEKANIKFTKITDDKPFSVNIEDINYTLYDVGTYNNALSSNNFNFKLNDNTKVSIVGAFNVQPFKMNGKVSISDLRLQELLDYKKEMFNFNLAKNSNFNLNLNYSLDTSKDLNLFIETTRLDFNNISLIKENKSLASFKKFSIKKVELDLLKQNINIEDTNLDKLLISMIQNKNGLNFDKLVNTKEDKAKTNTETKKQDKETKPWKIVLKNSNINNSSFTFDNKTNNTIASTKNFSTNISKVNIEGSKILLDTLSFNNPKLSFKDKTNKLDIKTKSSFIKMNNLKMNNANIDIAKLTLVNKNLDFVDLKNNLNIKSVNTRININGIKQNPDNLFVSSLKLFEPNMKIVNKKDKTNIFVKNINLAVSQITNNKDGLKVIRTDLSKPNIDIILSKKTVKKDKVIIRKIKKKIKEEGAKLNIGPINIKNAKLSFQDENLPLPFKTTVSKLNGQISRLDTRQASTSKLNVNGIVDKYGTTNISGIVDPSNIKILTDVNMIFKNIAMKNFTPYTAKFIGKELASGKLDLDLKYNIKKSDLDATNSIVITKLRVGKDIKSKDAVSVPVGLAIALLENSDGVIDLNIPVSGNVDNPQFKIAPIIWKALGNIITKAITAPFTLLASLFGFDENEIKNVKFDYAESKVTPIQKETLDKISKILTKRPQLALNLVPSYEKEKDSFAIKSQKLQKHVNTKLPNTQVKDYEDKYISLLEGLYLKAKKDIKTLKQNHTVKKVLNKKTYKKELEKTLILKQKVSKKELEKIALNRIKNIKEYLIKTKKTNIRQINLLKEVKIKNSKEKTSNIDLKIASVKN